MEKETGEAEVGSDFEGRVLLGGQVERCEEISSVPLRCVECGFVSLGSGKLPLLRGQHTFVDPYEDVVPGVAVFTKQCEELANPLYQDTRTLSFRERLRSVCIFLASK